MHKIEQRYHWEARLNELSRLSQAAKVEKQFGDGGYACEDLIRLCEREREWVQRAFDRCW